MGLPCGFAIALPNTLFLGGGPPSFSFSRSSSLGAQPKRPSVVSTVLPQSPSINVWYLPSWGLIKEKSFQKAANDFQLLKAPGKNKHISSSGQFPLKPTILLSKWKMMDSCFPVKVRELVFCLVVCLVIRGKGLGNQPPFSARLNSQSPMVSSRSGRTPFSHSHSESFAALSIGVSVCLTGLAHLHLPLPSKGACPI